PLSLCIEYSPEVLGWRRLVATAHETALVIDNLLSAAAMRQDRMKGYISSVGGSMSEAFWYYTGCM
ncbi:hypothetical protein MJN70_22055, partial [Salmonella enterica subsp. enterica serovar Kentucky]|nr:hypothetical protein [Salmonella enterica subsp. enterica serovar Kentucky]